MNKYDEQGANLRDLLTFENIASLISDRLSGREESTVTGVFVLRLLLTNLSCNYRIVRLISRVSST